jgi:hypothetical protein
MPPCRPTASEWKAGRAWSSQPGSRSAARDAGMDARPSVPGDGLLHCAACNLVPEPQRRAVRDQQSAARELPCTCSVLGKRSKQIQPDKRFPALSSCT